LSVLRRLWSGDALSPATGPIGPRPVRAGGPALLIGGYVPVIAQRIATWGDGYMAPGGGDPPALMDMWRRINAAWKEAGRAGRPRWVGASYFALGPNAPDHASRYIQANYGYNPDLAQRRLRALPTTPGAVADTIKRQVEMGVDEFILRPCAEDLDQMDRLAEIAVQHGSPP
jgi:alkanesulfonate monooxygenase SsuD/methylene tetrahydromethanopterin reductase-like flavin-dependent oxidoreductase (luciferase family)